MERPKSLTAAFVRTITEPGRYGDGRGSCGLYLRVHQMANGRISRSWGQRIRVGGQITNLGLGSFPAVTLATARARAVENAQMIAEGGDPRTPVATIPSFADALDRVMEIHATNWRNPKTAKQWRSSLETHAEPLMGMLVSEVTTADVLKCMVAMNGKKEIAVKVRQRIGAVMKWAIAQGFRTDDPTGGALTAVLPKSGQHTQHHRALPFAEVGAAIEKVRQTGAWPATKLAFELLVLTACRSGEVRLADCAEFDLDSAIWIIPASRMKSGREHRVPLSRQAVDVLRRAQGPGDGAGYVFRTATGKAMSDAALSKLLRENEVGAVPHGFRSSFRDWAAECTDVPREICEHALAHVEGNASELAYRRTDYFERRRGLMQQWADYVFQP